jgi:hypothetical protein
MYRALLIILSIPLALASVWAQDTTEYVQKEPPKEKRDTRPLKDRIWFGGGLGLNFGSVTAIQIEPLVGYKVDQAGKFSVGTGITYWYFSDNRYTPSVEYNAYGYRLFTRYRFIEQAYLHTEFLNLNAERYDDVTDDIRRIWVPHLLVGGGYIQPIGEHSSFMVQVLFEVLQDPNSVYYGQGPIFSAGVGFGF